jgi:hypothetical protein
MRDLWNIAIDQPVPAKGGRKSDNPLLEAQISKNHFI